MKFLFYEEGHEGAETKIEAEDREKAIKIFEKENRVKLDETDIYVLPCCPNCGKPLESIGWEEGGVLDVNRGTGTYSRNGQESGSFVCPECKKAFGGFGQSDWGFQPEVE